MIDLLVALSLGYLLGSVPFAAIAARSRGQRIFEVGSGNMGAMNTARNLGLPLGVAVFAADVAKGAAAAAVGLGMASLAGSGPGAALALALVGGVGAVVGHAWSVFVGFKGGKALAAAFGASLPVYPAAGISLAILLVALTLLLRRRPKVAAVITMALYPVVAYLAEMGAVADLDRAFAIVSAVLVISVVVIVKHLPRRPLRVSDAPPA
ncbi:MAG: glycerol-3-phosphate acyltransferase [Trueperaceae bacterium]|nr:glycerol-3-phosphate acyltransferase [Trueperaceae bacterium]